MAHTCTLLPGGVKRQRGTAAGGCCAQNLLGRQHSVPRRRPAFQVGRDLMTHGTGT